jgi:hypothetical protein
MAALLGAELGDEHAAARKIETRVTRIAGSPTEHAIITRAGD